MEGIAPGFMLSVGRLLAYKNLKAVVAAMTELCEHRLVVAGAGPELDRLRVLAGANVTFLGEVDEAELCWLYANCAGLVAASYEDYGLTPLEAAATVARRRPSASGVLGHHPGRGDGCVLRGAIADLDRRRHPRPVGTMLGCRVAPPLPSRLRREDVLPEPEDLRRI
jgi:hypothetical protein